MCGAAHTCWEWGWCETWPELPACTPRRLTPVAGPQLAAGMLTRGLWARGTPSKDAGPAPPVSPHKQPRQATAKGRALRGGISGMWPVRQRKCRDVAGGMGPQWPCQVFQRK